MKSSKAQRRRRPGLWRWSFLNQTNHYGTLFGDHALRLMDQAAFISASRYCRSTVVTASSEKVDFRTPVHQGELIELVARVIAVGRTSMTVEVEMFAERLLSGERALCTQGRFVLVALDNRGRPTAVPRLQYPKIQRQGS
jgi:acyl-CoA hydrolase